MADYGSWFLKDEAHRDQEQNQLIQRREPSGSKGEGTQKKNSDIVASETSSLLGVFEQPQASQLQEQVQAQIQTQRQRQGQPISLSEYSPGSDLHLQRLFGSHDSLSRMEKEQQMQQRQWQQQQQQQEKQQQPENQQKHQPQQQQGRRSNPYFPSNSFTEVTPISCNIRTIGNATTTTAGAAAENHSSYDYDSITEVCGLPSVDYNNYKNSSNSSRTDSRNNNNNNYNCNKSNNKEYTSLLLSPPSLEQRQQQQQQKQQQPPDQQIPDNNTLSLLFQPPPAPSTTTAYSNNAIQVESRSGANPVTVPIARAAPASLAAPANDRICMPLIDEQNRVTAVNTIANNNNIGNNINDIQNNNSNFNLLKSSTLTLVENVQRLGQSCRSELCKSTTWIGAFMALLIYVVFCLAMGSSFVLPNGSSSSSSSSSLMGIMTKMAALTTIVGPPVYIINLGDQIPAMYPVVDLFLAPFMANLAVIVDEALRLEQEQQHHHQHQHYNDNTTPYDTRVFLATFGFLAFFAMLLAGMFMILASIFKVANLGTFLPFPVLCGFFTTVGILMWQLAFAVDTNGKKLEVLFFSSWGNWELIQDSLLHHLPSFLMAICMKWLGPKNPLYSILVIFSSVAIFYPLLIICGVTVEEAREQHWFYSTDDIVTSTIMDTRPEDHSSGTLANFLDNWIPPAPFFVFNCLIRGLIHWGAVYKGLRTAFALAFLYLIRCSLQGAALKRNVPTLSRVVKQKQDTEEDPLTTSKSNPIIVGPNSPVLSPTPSSRHHHNRSRTRKFSEVVDIEDIMAQKQGTKPAPEMQLEEALPTTYSLQEILIQYGYSTLISSIVGGFVATPSVSASQMMYTLNAEGPAPQYLSICLLCFFYLTDFRLVIYIPKFVFSSLLMVVFIDTIITWFYKSYSKIHQKSEWLAVPLIVFFSFGWGVLNGVFLGIAISTFLFVATFFRSGVVKFVANGITIRSTIERHLHHQHWLDEHGNLLQVLVLQNYLFFGNASSILTYITCMFDETNTSTDHPQQQEQRHSYENHHYQEQQQHLQPTPPPKFIILDMSLVTGMDTSSVDVLSDIIILCKTNNCKLFLSGVYPNLRSILSIAGVKPEGNITKSKRTLRFFQDLDTAIGKAEDLLLQIKKQQLPQREQSSSLSHHGFTRALHYIDEQHGTKFLKDLVQLEKYTTPVTLAPNCQLYGTTGSSITNGNERGLFFIEEGIMRLERDTSSSVQMTRSGGRGGGGGMIHPSDMRMFMTMNSNATSNYNGSLNELALHRGTINRKMIQQQLSVRAGQQQQQNFRLARIGAGWIVGDIEAATGMENPGVHIAVTQCQLHYLPYSRIQDIEKENPALILNLYKLMSCLMAKRQEVTIGQLATLHSIMSSPAQTKPISRKATMMFQNMS